jgi:hypothetical protein
LITSSAMADRPARLNTKHRLRYRACSAAGLSDGCRELASLSVGRTICER